MTGGHYGLAGGVRSVIAAVPTPGAPTLMVTLTKANTVLVCWPSPSTGFLLQQNPNLGTTNVTMMPARGHRRGAGAALRAGGN